MRSISRPRQVCLDSENIQTQESAENPTFAASGMADETPLTPAESWRRQRPAELDNENFQASRAEAVSTSTYLWRITFQHRDGVIFVPAKDKYHATAVAIMRHLARPGDFIRDFDDCPTIEMIAIDVFATSLTVVRTEPESLYYVIEQLLPGACWETIGRVWAGSELHAHEISRTRWGQRNFRASLRSHAA